MRRLLEFHRSPNSVKARVGLNAKGLEFTAEEMASADRAPMIEAAGWPLVPILIDGDVRIRDSAAILHYLESNYREGTSLTPASRDDILAAEALLLNLRPEILRIQWSLQPELQKPEEERSAEKAKVVRRTLNDALMRLAARFTDAEWLVGDAMSMYDVILACDLLPTRPPARFVVQSPMWRYFAQHLCLDEDRAPVARWIDRVMAWDPGPPPAPAEAPPA